tara:strand:+ start:9362 stop:10867 length:1506 start_codon:yes stop_codon:yes gene_type:complete
MADIIQIRRDTAANWTSANPTLAQGELGAETDTSKVKIGDGSTAWSSLGYLINTNGYLQDSNNLSELNSAATALTNLGLTATATELNYTDGVTSSIQSQIDNIDALPSQTGNAGKVLTTDGTNPSWGDTNGFGTPINSSPAQGATAIPVQATLIGSTYINLDGLAMAAAHWQISLVSDFATTVFDSEVAGASTQITLSSSLTAVTVHYWRVRYKDSQGTYTPYSTGTSFTSASPIGQQLYSSAGSYSWTAPTGVTSVSAVVIGGGGGGPKAHDGNGGGGGALSYLTSYTVVAGNSYTVYVGGGGNGTTNSTGNAGTGSYFVNTSTLYAAGGNGGPAGNQGPVARTTGRIGSGGGEGGAGVSSRGGACGAGGYAGNGGDCAYTDTQPSAAPAGGGGSASYNFDSPGSHGGGGVGILGQGASGGQCTSSQSDAYGLGGSGGDNGGLASGPFSSGSSGTGGRYGGGGGRGSNNSGVIGGYGGSGGVRIIWGNGRAYPSTNTGDL